MSETSFGDETVRRETSSQRPFGDKVFRRVTTAGAAASLVIMGLITAFLVRDAIPAFRTAGAAFFTTFEWNPDDIPARFGIGSMLYGTVVASVVALVIAVPVSVGTALFIREYAPRRARTVLITLVDLLAAIPSLIFGLWGLSFLQPKLEGTSRWLSTWLKFIPIFKTKVPIFGSSLFVSGLVLAIMIVPIVTSVSLAVMAEVPRANCEAALALGGTKAGMIREVVLPFARPGLVGASMLGLGRALGETMAVALILSNDFRIPTNVLSPGGATVAGTIALRFNEAGPFARHALVAAGLVLFVVTLIVNLLARTVTRRSTSQKGPR